MTFLSGISNCLIILPLFHDETNILFIVVSWSFNSNHVEKPEQKKTLCFILLIESYPLVPFPASVRAAVGAVAGVGLPLGGDGVATGGVGLRLWWTGFAT